MHRILKSAILLSAGLILAMSFSAFAEVPPPPVNQRLAIPDSVFNELQEEDCRVCHNENPPEGIPVDPTYLPDRHHLLVDTPIPPNSDAPNGDPNGDGLYECLSCHTTVWNPVTFSFEFAPYRDCLLCHQQNANEPTVHHKTNAAQIGDCQACHGSFVDNGLLDDDGDGIRNAIDYDDQVNPANGWVPDGWKVSLVTPWPSAKPNGGDGGPPNEGGIKEGGDLGAGNCNFCHNTIALPGVKLTPTLDPESGVLVYTNNQTHHSTGLALDGNKCKWCHSQDPSNEPVPIRVCGNCHGIPSLHNIQFGLDKSATGPGVTPGQEEAYYGHIGQQKDCWGCHGNNGQTMSASGSGPVIPFITSLSVSSMTAGTATPASVFGEGFINSIQNPMTGAYDISLDCDIKLVDNFGNAIVLEPTQITPTQIDVVLPADLAAGTYKLTAVKGPKFSNPKVLCVTNPVAISSANCSAGVVTIDGSGFNAYSYASNSGTGVTFAGKPAAILSWSDDQIVANIGTCIDEITVATLFDEVSTAVEFDAAAAIAPVADRLNRTVGRTGHTRRIYGQNFGNGTDGKVMFGSIEADVRSWSNNLIKFKVPAVSKGTYDVTVQVGGSSSEPISFRKR